MNNIKLHEYQKQILKKLCNVPFARFNDLILEGLVSEHMNYHLKKMMDFNLVEKQDFSYKLTDRGKDFVNLMDDKVEFIEKQPKTSVLLHVVRKNKQGIVEHLMNKRLKHPYYGKIGRLTGKVQFGEKLEEAARRELFEETGLHAKTIVLEQIYHKLRHRENGEYVQDNIFYRFFITDTYGEFITKTAHQENLWISLKDLNNPKYDFYDDIDIDERIEPLQLSILEHDSVAEGY